MISHDGKPDRAGSSFTKYYRDRHLILSGATGRYHTRHRCRHRQRTVPDWPHVDPTLTFDPVLQMEALKLMFMYELYGQDIWHGHYTRGLQLRKLWRLRDGAHPLPSIRCTSEKYIEKQLLVSTRNVDSKDLRMAISWSILMRKEQNGECNVKYFRRFLRIEFWCTDIQSPQFFKWLWILK